MNLNCIITHPSCSFCSPDALVPPNADENPKNRSGAVVAVLVLSVQVQLPKLMPSPYAVHWESAEAPWSVVPGPWENMHLVIMARPLPIWMSRSRSMP